ncbi:MAG TPA: lipid II flippase MurJ, partial [Hyphomicrobium sp.]
ATTLGGWLNAGLLHATLVRRGYLVADQRLKRTLPRTIVSSLAMGAALWIVADMLEGSFGVSAPPLVRVAALAGLVGSGLAVYTMAVFATGALDMRQLRSFLKRRSPPAPI